jgi:hypothetical protein
MSSYFAGVPNLSLHVKNKRKYKYEPPYGYGGNLGTNVNYERIDRRPTPSTMQNQYYTYMDQINKNPRSKSSQRPVENIRQPVKPLHNESYVNDPNLSIRPIEMILDKSYNHHPGKGRTTLLQNNSIVNQNNYRPGMKSPIMNNKMIYSNPNSREGLRPNGGQNEMRYNDGRNGMRSNGGQNGLSPKGGQSDIRSNGGQNSLRSNDVQNEIRYNSGRNGLRSNGGQDDFRSNDGQNGLRNNGAQNDFRNDSSIDQHYLNNQKNFFMVDEKEQKYDPNEPKLGMDRNWEDPRAMNTYDDRNSNHRNGSGDNNRSMKVENLKQTRKNTAMAILNNTTDQRIKNNYSANQYPEDANQRLSANIMREQNYSSLKDDKIN